MTFSNDLPISSPADDRFGLNPFAEALAKSIIGMEAPAGAVLAVNGEWGSGKSSAINLIKHHLTPAIDKGEIVMVPFNPWWFAGSDALTLAFFQELSKAIGPSLPEKLRKSIAVMGQGVSAVGAVAGAMANLKAPGFGEIIAGATGLVGKLTAMDTTVEEQHQKVSKALREQQKRFLIVIDDIDRLNPDDALTIFRLVKSVGRLPNVIYLLAFDRQIAERIVTERFPSEGASYLEKILQGAFELPPPLPDVLRWQCAEVAYGVMGAPDKAKESRFWNVFHDVVSPTIRTPRDVARLGNQLSATWPAVANNVDRADFLAITALQLAEPSTYAAIRQNPDELTGLGRDDGRRRDNLGAEYDALLGIVGRPDREARRLRIALRRLFPRLDSVWGNTYYSGDSWRRERLIASREHFRSYFAFSISDDVVPAELIDGLVARAADGEFVRETLRKALSTVGRTGATQASLLLDELKIYATEVAEENVGALTATLFAMADELDVESDALKGFGGLGNNQMRLHWIMNYLVHDRFPIERREEIYREAMQGASVEWCSDFAERCIRPYRPSDEERERGEPVVSQAVAEEFIETALAKLRAAAAEGSLTEQHRIISLLYTWRRLAGEHGTQEVRNWTDAALSNAAFIVTLARHLPSSSWSFGMGMDDMGDRVQRETRLVEDEAHAELLSIERLDARIAEELEKAELPQVDLEALREFQAIPRGSHRRLRD